MRFISQLVALMLTGLALLGNAAYADNFDTLRLHDLDNSLKRHSGNIIAIRQEILEKGKQSEQNVKEGEYSDAALSVLSNISIEAESIIAKQSLLGAMESEHGKSIVKTRKNDDVRLLNGECGSYLEELNSSLGKIENSALIFEVKSARDDVVKICSTIQRWE